MASEVFEMVQALGQAEQAALVVLMVETELVPLQARVALTAAAAAVVVMMVRP